jgi:hypothetical protein
MSSGDVERLSAHFAGAADASGFVSGNNGVALLTQYGLPNETLKVIWDLADADVDGKLSKREFLVAFYLVERAREGLRMPSSIPPGPFPPMAGPSPPLQSGRFPRSSFGSSLGGGAPPPLVPAPAPAPPLPAAALPQNGMLAEDWFSGPSAALPSVPAGGGPGGGLGGGLGGGSGGQMGGQVGGQMGGQMGGQGSGGAAVQPAAYVSHMPVVGDDFLAQVCVWVQLGGVARFCSSSGFE